MAGRKGKRNPDYTSNELTVYDFADSSRPAACGRIKKGAANRGIVEVKKISSGPGMEGRMRQEEEEELSWFEKDLDDFDIPLPPIAESDAEEEEDQGEGTQQAAARNRRGGRGGKRGGKRGGGSQRRSDDEGKRGVVYPVDLWHVLADHIHPSAIQHFAAICRDTYLITRQPRFWRGLYKRYYSKEEELAVDLKPQAMERTHGLRARCVRALFILDPCLKQRVQPKGHFEADAHSLIGYRCLLVWHQPCQGKWNFCFKLQRPSLRPHARNINLRPAQMEDMRNGYNNVFYNPEDGCCVLQVTTTHFAHTSPHVMGQLLSAVHLNLSINCLHQRLRLSFNSSPQLADSSSSSSSSRYSLETFFDPAISIRIFHWWDPNYPFPT